MLLHGIKCNIVRRSFSSVSFFTSLGRLHIHIIDEMKREKEKNAAVVHRMSNMVTISAAYPVPRDQNHHYASYIQAYICYILKELRYYITCICLYIIVYVVYKDLSVYTRYTVNRDTNCRWNFRQHFRRELIQRYNISISSKVVACNEKEDADNHR